MTNISFDELGLIKPILRALHDEKYDTPTPIQAQAIPSLLDGADLLGCAQTGTGKTAAFVLPMLQRFADGNQSKKRSPRALILTPTRELADQIGHSIKAYGRYLKVSSTVVFGGVNIVGQSRALSRGVDILVATPGRLLDLMRQRLVFLDRLEVFVLDEADRMLDMGFINDIKTVISTLPEDRQSLFFSATMPRAAMEISSSILKDPVKVTINPTSTTAENVEQKVFFVERHNKEALLLHLLEDSTINRALVFTRTKHKANNIAKKLNGKTVIAEAIHGNKSQGARMRALRNFSSGRARVLVATDVASRGIDIKDVSHVINFEMPTEAESYVHRIGRTARAGSAGSAISFCDSEEMWLLKSIEGMIKTNLPVDDEHPYHLNQTPASRPKENRTRNRYGSGRNRNRNSRPRRSGAYR